MPYILHEMYEKKDNYTTDKIKLKLNWAIIKQKYPNTEQVIMQNIFDYFYDYF